MYSASVTVNLKAGETAKVLYSSIVSAGSVSSSNISSFLGTAGITLPSTMHAGNPSKTYITVTQLDNSESTRGKLSFSYSVAGNCQTATIYFRDVTSTITNGTALSMAYIVVQDKS